MGPTVEGDFKLVQVREIHFLRETVNELCCGNSCALRLKNLDKSFELKTSNFRKGMVLLDVETKPQSAMEFEIEALIVHHSSTIKVGYQSVVHCHVIRQTCTVVEMDKQFLRSGDTGNIKFKFMKKPEYLHLGDTLLFREGRTRGKGKITKIFPMEINKVNKDKKANTNKNQQNKINMKNKENKKVKKKCFKKSDENKNNQNQINNSENTNKALKNEQG